MNTATLSGYAVLGFLTVVSLAVLVSAIIGRIRQRRLVAEFDAALTRVEEELRQETGVCPVCLFSPGLHDVRKHTAAGIPTPRKAP